MGYFSIRIQTKVEFYEKIAIPLLTGISSLLVLIEPNAGSHFWGDFCFIPILLAGLRYGLPCSLLSTLIPAAYLLIVGETGWLQMIILDLLIPAGISAIFYKPTYRGRYVSIPLRNGVIISVLFFMIHVANQFASDWKIHFDLLSDMLFQFCFVAATLSVLIGMINDDSRSWMTRRKLEMQANQDGLTKLPNLRSFMNIARNAVWDDTMSILMIDIDNFKNYNDTLGHLQGDVLLREVGYVLKNAIGSKDYIARYGGEEFIVLCHTRDNGALRKLAGNLCSSVSNQPFPHREVQPGQCITISVGISASCSSALEIQDLIAEADAALYLSKTTGKNKYSFYTELSSA
ncbi:GGDEF domain-containing protein [Gorillibacterium massiliense]|uniref:GGDEF domain-containing protein n=1 Tax=Gorillibacterium massiliense TaxID=1280390 RepID=UPI001EE24D7B|nr:GGDEF domain-containing protein [Gorillibacterium massiliense]